MAPEVASSFECLSTVEEGEFFEAEGCKEGCECRGPKCPCRCVLVDPEYQGVSFECGLRCHCKFSNCVNRSLTRGIRQPGLEVRPTLSKGLGLFTMGAIKAGTFLCEYTGDIITEGSASPYSLRVCEQGKHLYTIDSAKRGNASRFVNHSCGFHANVRLELVRVNGIRPRVALVTKADVGPGEELTFEYSETCELPCEGCVR